MGSATGARLWHQFSRASTPVPWLAPISCAPLVLMMTIPGLALFYAGMVRKRTARHHDAELVAVGIVSYPGR